MKDLLWINRWDGRRKNSAKEKQTIGQSFISNYNITDFKQVLPELWVGLAMNIGSENSRYVTFIPPTTNEVIKLRISDHPSNENEWGEKELTGLPNRRYSIVIFSNKSMPNESNKDVKYLPWRSYSAQNIPVHEITFNRFYLIETFSLLKTILETIYNGGSPEKTTNNVSENKQLKSNNSMKQTIRLTESDIRRMVMEAMNELDWKTYANAGKQATKRGFANYWKEKGVNGYDAISNAAKERVRAKRFGNAAKDAFNRDFGYQSGEDMHDDNYQRVGMGGDFGASDEFAPHVAGWKHATTTKDDGYESFNKFPYGSYTSERTPEGFFGDNPDAILAYNNAKDEIDNYNKGNYRYEKGKGWTKDELEEAVTRAIRKYLR